MNSPIFFMCGEEIVDVFYGNFKANVNPVDGWAKFGPATGSGDKIIIEGPDGCWETPVGFQEGDYLEVRISPISNHGGGDGYYSFQRCQRLSPELVSVAPPQDHEPAIQ